MRHKFSLVLILQILIYLHSSFAQFPQMNFPLQVGNRWQYSEELGNYSESLVIRNTRMSNGLIYAQVQGELFSGYFRQDSERVYVYNSSDSSETLIYDFSKKVGDTLFLQISGKDTIIETVYSEGLTFVLGVQRYCMAFLTKHTQSTMHSIDYITDGIGFTSYNGEVLSYGLSGAIINGIQYGVILGIPSSDQKIPIQYQLFQNYPNPFNPETNISFSIPTQEHVVLQIFDQLGKLITTLVSSKMSPGFHTILWNAQNISSGVYYYRINIGKFILTRSMLLVK